jgi:large subunit ribosomal protein L9
MASTNLLLLEPIEHLGNEGEQVTVKAGYARNFLLPRGKALPLTRANKRQMESLARRREDRLKRELEGARETGEKLSRTSIAFAVKTGPGGRVFGAVTSQNLVDRLAEEGIALERKQLSLHTPVKSLGKHTTTVRLHAEVSVDFEFEVVSENPIEEIEGAKESENAS